MHFTFTLADKIDPVAVYAAAMATLVFVWNVFVWRNSGPRLNVTASMNMLIIGGYGDDDDKMFLVVRATNVGGKKTTVTNVLIVSYKNVWEYLRNSPSFTAIFNNTEPAFPLPYVLDVGHTLMNKADQTGLIERIRDTYFYAGVQHSFSDKPVMVRVRYSDPKK